MTTEREDNRTLAQLAAEAIAVQDACNLSGVVLSYGRALSRLCQLLPDASTEARNRQLIAQVWADKVADLAGVSGETRSWAWDAYSECTRLAVRFGGAATAPEVAA